MKATWLENMSVALAALVTGIMAGFFYTYTFNVNLAMLEVDGPTYATVQSLFNRNVRHPMFFVCFFGAAVVPAAALACNWRRYRSLSFWMVALASLLYLAGVVIFTANVNLPLNAYTESWNPLALPADWVATRDAWNDANTVRVGVAFASFVLCIAALVVRASERDVIREGAPGNAKIGNC